MFIFLCLYFYVLLSLLHLQLQCNQHTGNGLLLKCIEILLVILVHIRYTTSTAEGGVLIKIYRLNLMNYQMHHTSELALFSSLAMCFHCHISCKLYHLESGLPLQYLFKFKSVIEWAMHKKFWSIFLGMALVSGRLSYPG